MWIFIDDSGDCGFKFENGSSRYVVMAACIFRERANIEHALRCIQEARKHEAPDGTTYIYSREFKYSKSSNSCKDKFFEAMRAAQFHVRAIILDKRKVRSDHLLSHPRDLKSYLIRQMLTHTYGTVQHAKLVIDGQDTRAFGMSDRTYFTRMVNSEKPGTLREVEWADSQKNGLVQLADMTAGSLRKWMEDDPSATSHFETYRHRTWQPSGSIWDFQ